MLQQVLTISTWTKKSTSHTLDVSLSRDTGNPDCFMTTCKRKSHSKTVWPVFLLPCKDPSTLCPFLLERSAELSGLWSWYCLQYNTVDLNYDGSLELSSTPPPPPPPPPHREPGDEAIKMVNYLVLWFPF